MDIGYMYVQIHTVERQIFRNVVTVKFFIKNKPQKSSKILLENVPTKNTNCFLVLGTCL